jgi:hypothetical protein
VPGGDQQARQRVIRDVVDATPRDQEHLGYNVLRGGHVRSLPAGTVWPLAQ